MAADGLKVLGQLAPAATTDTTLYTVPASTKTTVSTLTVCNRAATATSFRVSVRPAGATLANQHYIYYDQAIDGNSTFASTIGMTLAATDVITVYAANANLSFTAFGVEVA
jgi:hypothetical protein